MGSTSKAARISAARRMRRGVKAPVGIPTGLAPFANGVIASVVGMWVGAVVTRLIRSVGAGRSARRLVRINRQSLAAAAAAEAERR